MRLINALQIVIICIFTNQQVVKSLRNERSASDPSTTTEKSGDDKLAETRDWLERFSQQLRKAFLQYSRADVIKKELSEHENTNSAQTGEDENVDENEKFVQASHIISQRLNKFFEKKMLAMKKLAHKAEHLSREYYQRSAKSSKLKEVEQCKMLIDAINRFLLTPNKPVQDTNDTNNATSSTTTSTTTTTVPPSIVLDLPVTIHVALSEYKCDTKILEDFEWMGNNEIISVLKENLARDSTIARQYIASYNGFTQLFPAFKWDVLPSEYTVDLFDSRFRTWFTAAEVAPRDVLFLIDYSGSVRGVTLHMTKTLILHILSTLTANDFFTGVWYNSRRDLVLAECLPKRHGGAGAKFLPATTRNKQLFQRYLDRIEDRDQATLPIALNLSLTQFLQNSVKDLIFPRSDASGGAWERERRTSGGHKLILLFSDGIELWPVDVIKQFQEQYPEDKVRIFGYAMGRGTGRLPALDWVTCATGGGIGTYPSTTVGSIAEVKQRSRAYLPKLSEVLALVYRNKTISHRPITWSAPYMDAQKLGAVLSLSMPILDWSKHSAHKNVSHPTTNFRAVAGIDFALDELREIFGIFSEPTLTTFETNSENNGGPTYYAFLVDNNGIVHYHPQLKLPKTEAYMVRRTACHQLSKLHRYTNTRVQYGRADEHVRRVMGYVDSIPTLDVLEFEFRPSTTFRKFREKIIAGECDFEHGHSVRDEAQKREYRCYHIANTPFTVGFVHNEQQANINSLDANPLYKLPIEEINENVLKNEKKTAFVRKPTNDPLGYWLRDTKTIAAVCGRRNGIDTDLNSIEKSKRFEVLTQLIADGKCLIPMPGQTLSFLQGDKLSSQMFSSLFSADFLLAKWRDTWPHASHMENFDYASQRRRRDNEESQKVDEKKENVACIFNNTQFTIPRAFDIRYFISSFVDIPAASLAAFFPKCQLSNISFILDSYLPNSQLMPLPRSERMKLRVDVVSAASSEVEGGASAAHHLPFTIVVAEKVHTVADSGYLHTIATIGAQFTSNFLHDKFQKSLNASAGDSGKSWPECQMPDRRCYLITTSAYIVASTEKTFSSIVHLSVAEPQIFEHLIKGDVIQKTTWTDHQAECTVANLGGADPHSVRKQLELQRQLFDGLLESDSKSEEESDENVTISTSEVDLTTESAPTAALEFSSASSVNSPRFLIRALYIKIEFGNTLAYFVSLWFKFFTRIESLFGIFMSLASKANSIDTNEDKPHSHSGNVDHCEYGSNSDMASLSYERCVVEHTHYTMRARQTLSVKSVHYRIGCNSDLIIVPSTTAQLHLLILDEKCDNFPTIPTSHRFLPHKVADCGMTSTRSRRLRTDMDYTRGHPQESEWACSIQSSASSFSAHKFSWFYLFIAIYIFLSQFS